MKKLFALLLCLAMLATLIGCATDEDDTTAAPETTTEETTTEDTSSEETSSEESTTEEITEPGLNGDEMSLTEIVEELYNGYSEEDLPVLETYELTSENFEWVAFIPYVEGYEAVASEPMMSSIAHSVVLVRVPDGTDVESVRSAIEANLNPAKWVCVEAEKTTVIAHNNTILMVMSTVDRVDTISANFDALWN